MQVYKVNTRFGKKLASQEQGATRKQRATHRKQGISPREQKSGYTSSIFRVRTTGSSSSSSGSSSRVGLAASADVSCGSVGGPAGCENGGSGGVGKGGVDCGNVGCGSDSTASLAARVASVNSLQAVPRVGSISHRKLRSLARIPGRPTLQPGSARLVER